MRFSRTANGQKANFRQNKTLRKKAGGALKPEVNDLK
jgi:hypothetical protein